MVTLEPFYDAYGAMIALAGARHVTVPLRALDFQPDPDALRAAVSDRTRIILINSPHNPTGTVLDTPTFLELVIELAHRHDAIIVTDEVYEHLIFDGVAHIPISTLPGGRERTISISSGGKTFSATGWKVGWLTAPANCATLCSPSSSSSPMSMRRRSNPRSRPACGCPMASSRMLRRPSRPSATS